MLVALTATLLIGLPGRADSTIPVPVLGHDNLVRADRSASMLVDVPANATFSLDPAQGDFVVNGTGRIIGFSLQAVDRSLPSDAVHVISYNGCFSSGCAPDGPEVFISGPFASEAAADEDSRGVLRPGRYRLAVLTDGGTVLGRLKLTGLMGSKILTPVLPAESGFAELQSTSLGPGPAANVVWSAGAGMTLASTNSLLLGFVQQDATVSVGGVIFGCHFSGGARPWGGHYLPGCPAEGGDLFTNVLSGASGVVPQASLAGGRLRAHARFPTFVGEQQVGFHLTRPGVAGDARGVTAFLRLD